MDEGGLDDQLVSAVRAGDAEAVRALLEGGASPDAVDGSATELAVSPDRRPAVADTLWALLGEDNHVVRLEAAHGLAQRDDPRTDRAIDRADPFGGRFEHDHCVNALWEWKQRRANPPAE